MGGGPRMGSSRSALSVCMTCRDGREGARGTRGGAQLAGKIAAKKGNQSGPELQPHGVHCTNRCTRSCIVSLAGDGRCTYVFGEPDTDNDRHIEAIFELASTYPHAPEGFLDRKDRLEELRANSLGRRPPLGSPSPRVSGQELTGP